MSSARSTAMNIDAPEAEVQVDEILFDTNMYKEGRPCVHVRTCDRKQGVQLSMASCLRYGELLVWFRCTWLLGRSSQMHMAALGLCR